VNRFAEKVNKAVDSKKYIFTKNLKHFFDLDNTYVLKKLLLILIPFTKSGEWVLSDNYIEND